MFTILKTTIAAGAVLAAVGVASFPVAAQMLPNRYGNDSNSLHLYDNQGGFHGNLNANPYDPNSVSNQFGPYGSPYSSQSVNNPYGQFGRR